MVIYQPFYSYELAEVNSDIIKQYYEESFKRIPNYKRGENIKFYRLDGIANSNNKEIVDKTLVKDNGTVSSSEKSNVEEDLIKTSLHIVVVDEGEGFVVDYYTEILPDEI